MVWPLRHDFQMDGIAVTRPRGLVTSQNGVSRSLWKTEFEYVS